ncbi:hypothetical protein D770_11490 [Flammeovirgaceae bacterium 311]|nr:hypothetical protein D770_11490 [Flammeovirgaceae bacterium 311]
MRQLTIYFILLLIQGLTACEREEINENDSASTEGFATGKVTDTHGRPFPGVEVIVDNLYLYDANALGTTNDKGEYKIELGFGTFRAYARYMKQYNGKEYALELHPETDEGFTQEGAVRNFQWKLTGKKPGTSSGYYGGLIEINKGVNSQIYDTENIEFTLTPVGPLIDGSEGEVIIRKPGQPATESYSKLLDLPIGKYNISAVYKGASEELPIKLKNFENQNSEYVSNLVIDFEPQTSSCFNCVNLLYNE